MSDANQPSNNRKAELLYSLACQTLPGISAPIPPPTFAPYTRQTFTTQDYIRGILDSNVSMLSRAITLIESSKQAHRVSAQSLLTHLLPHTGHSIRIGITGVPGSGKSTLIDALGYLLCEQGKHVAVLAVDPSSTIHGGSILGDKTRMPNLAKHPNAYIRPSPSGGILGGVNSKTRETILLCEAAGYQVILVETVGVGQNEITVRSMVDFFLLVLISGAGDELQGIKKGIIEIADLITINKADGNNIQSAALAQTEYSHALHGLTPATTGWSTECITTSAFQPESLLSLWQRISDFQIQTTRSGTLSQRRSQQTIQWMHAMIENELKNRFSEHPVVKQRIPELEGLVATQAMPVATAVETIFRELMTHLRSDSPSRP